MPSQLDLFPTDLYLRAVDPARQVRRFYALSIQRTLFGEWTLTRAWGRTGASTRTRQEIYESAGEAIDALCAAAAHKRRRGYTG